MWIFPYKITIEATIQGGILTTDFRLSFCFCNIYFYKDLTKNGCFPSLTANFANAIIYIYVDDSM